jgi:hypothetical protein
MQLFERTSYLLSTLYILDSEAINPFLRCLSDILNVA